jgi:diadenylate cyclase
MTIFFPNTTLHDGAVIIRDNRVIAASAVLPLGGSITTANNELLGTRHRAALGITESTDAVAVVVSEETGAVSVAHNGQLFRHLDQKRLEQLLRAFFKAQLAGTIPQHLRSGQGVLARLGLVKSNKNVASAQSQSKQ